MHMYLQDYDVAEYVATFLLCSQYSITAMAYTCKSQDYEKLTKRNL